MSKTALLTKKLQEKQQARQNTTQDLFEKLIEAYRGLSKGLQENIQKELRDHILILKAQEKFAPSFEKYIQTLKREVQRNENDPSHKIDEASIEKAKSEYIATTSKVQDLLKHKAKLADPTTEDPKKAKFMEDFAKAIDCLSRLKQDSPERNKFIEQLGKEFSLEVGDLREVIKLPKKQVIRDEDADSTVKPLSLTKIEEQIKQIKKSSTEEVDSTIKSLEQLLQEIGLLSDAQNRQLELDCAKVKSFSHKWEKASPQEINKWAVSRKGKLVKEEVYEAIAVMDRANELVTGGHHLRDSQILSVLAFLSSQEGMGRLCQINTGEGKTTITAILAAIKVLQGEKVDVITSNNVLADEGVKSKELFYGLLGISACSNNGAASPSGTKECYRADIVYGSIANFQFDYLRHEFEGLGTRCGRKFGAVILDEVDNMVIDNGGHIAKLASPFPGMQSLQYIYIKIWQELLQAEKHLEKGLQEAVAKKQKEISDKVVKEELPEAEADKIYDGALKQIHEEFDKNLFRKLVQHIKESDPLKNELIPEHLINYAKEHLDIWIKNAIYAKYHCHENEQYVIKCKSGRGNKSAKQRLGRTYDDSEEVETESNHNAFNQKDNPSYWYQATDIETILHQFRKAHGAKFFIPKPLSDSQLSDAALESVIKSDKDVLCVYNKGGNHWVVFAVVKAVGSSKLTVFYKDSYGEGNAQLSARILKIFPDAEFVSNKVKEQTSGVDCGIFAIKNLSILADHISKLDKGNEKQCSDFVEQFKELRGFCSLEGAQKFRKADFAEFYKTGITHEIQAEKLRQAKLLKLRENHEPELDQLADLLKKVDGLKDLEIQPLKGKATPAAGITSTIFIDIGTAPDPDFMVGEYRYQYRISFSSDLRGRSEEIVSKLPSAFRGDYAAGNNVVRISPDVVTEIRKNLKKPVLAKNIKVPPVEKAEINERLQLKKSTHHATSKKALPVKEPVPSTEAVDALATDSEEDSEYQVVPVDYINTGQTMKNTIWSHALHQFIQLKHNLHLTAETLTSSYISNLGYIKKYGVEIFGLTGTLGSTAEQELISSTYRVDYCKVPTYKTKDFQEIEGVIIADDEWTQAVTIDAVHQAEEEGRAVLIICQTISDAMVIIESLNFIKQEENLAIKIKSYCDEESAYVTEEMLVPGDIVVATNISGRGTDFSTSPELEANGGLHVCIGFLPCNQRVEDQAFGRTSRQGNHGTGQLMLRESELSQLPLGDLETIDIGIIKKARDKLERSRLEKVKSVDKPDLEFRDKIFEHFLEIYKQLKSKARANPEIFYTLRDLKEYWAFWLEQQNFKKIQVTDEAIAGKFKEFIEAAKTKGILVEKAPVSEQEQGELVTGKIQHNPYYAIALAEAYLQECEIDKAEKVLQEAFTFCKTPDLLYSAHFKSFEIAMEKGGVLMQRFKDAMAKVAIFGYFTSVKDEAYKGKAQGALEKAKSALDKEIDYIVGLFETRAFQEISISEISHAKGSNYFIKHLHSRFQALNVYKSAVNSLQEQLKLPSDKGLAINSRIPDYLVKLDPKSEQGKQIKRVIHNEELSELSQIGLETIYAIREVHDVPTEIIAAAQGQIVAGLGLLTASVAFPPSAPVTFPLANTMISEGICDVIMDLLSRGEHGFDGAAYAKSKAISYGLSLATMGLSVIASSKTILKNAIKACKSVAETLRKSTVMKSVCEKLATQIDKWCKLLEKALEAAKLAENFSKLSKAEQFVEKNLTKAHELTKLKQFSNSLGKIVLGTGKTIATSIAMEKVVTASLKEVMQGLKPGIKEKVKKDLSENIDKSKLKVASNLDTAVKEATDGKILAIIQEVAQEIALGIGRHGGNWKVKLGALAIDSIISGVKIDKYTEAFCRKLNEKLIAGKENNDVEKIIDTLSEQLSETIYAMAVGLTGKIATTLPGIVKDAATDLHDKYKQKKAEQAKQVAKEMEELSTRAKAQKDKDKACVDSVLSLLDPTGEASDVTEPKNQPEALAATKKLLEKNGDKVYEENLGAPTRKKMLNALKKHGGDEAMLLLSSADGEVGHAVFVKKVGNKIVMIDPGTGKVMDHQQTKAYIETCKYSKAAIIGREPAGYKEPTFKKFVRKTKETVGISAKPDKPFDEGVKFAGKPGSKTEQAKARAETEARGKAPVEAQVIIKPETGFAKLQESQYSMKDPKHPMANGKKQALDLLGKNSDFTTHKKQDDILKNKGDSICHLDTRDSGSDKFATEIQLKQAHGNKTTVGVVHYTDKHSPSEVRAGLKLSIEKGKVVTLNGSSDRIDIGEINHHFAAYTLDAVKEMLTLRVKDQELEAVEISTGNYFVINGTNNISALITELDSSAADIILVPINMHDKHAVGVIAIKEGDSLRAYYLDPANEKMPEDLSSLFACHGIEVQQLKVEQQRYGNCGSEVIENFILYLTGKRLSQEEAITYHSWLYEQSLTKSVDFTAVSIMDLYPVITGEICEYSELI